MRKIVFEHGGKTGFGAEDEKERRAARGSERDTVIPAEAGVPKGDRNAGMTNICSGKCLSPGCVCSNRKHASHGE
jgi:hypothetical protein